MNLKNFLGLNQRDVGVTARALAPRLAQFAQRPRRPNTQRGTAIRARIDCCFLRRFFRQFFVRKHLNKYNTVARCIRWVEGERVGAEDPRAKSSARARFALPSWHAIPCDSCTV